MAHKSFKILDGIKSTIGELTNIEIEIPDFAKKIFSKNFKGGEIVNIFGGTEIDLSQADINGEVRLELTQMFGGTKLIIPGSWKLIVKNAAILGGIEDKRPNQPLDPNKILILTGTSMFGGIEIRSY